MMNEHIAQKDEISTLIEQEEREKARLEKERIEIIEKIENKVGSIKENRDIY